MEKVFEEMIQKSRVLSSWTREKLDSVNRLRGAWERLQNLLENHQHIIAKQVRISSIFPRTFFFFIDI